MESFWFQRGETPVLLSIPHVGTEIPPSMAVTMTDAGRAVPDTDWHLDRLYHFAPALGVGLLKARYSRHVIDLNRDPAGGPLYPKADNTELCPTTTFDRLPIYQPGQAPDAAGIIRRLDSYWRPYHRHLAAELAALRDRFGVAVLLDAHSIRSEVPRFFQGRLSDFNLGTADGRSAAADLPGRLMNVLGATDRYTAVLNGRFKGGYITRHHGNPGDGIHAVQLEQSQVTYMNETPPFGFRTDLADQVRPSLERVLQVIIEWAWEQTKGRSHTT